MSSNYALVFWKPSLDVAFDSRAATGGVVAGVYEVAPGASLTVNLTGYAGKQVRAVKYGFPTATISYASGYPSVTISTPSSMVRSALVYLFVF